MKVYDCKVCRVVSLNVERAPFNACANDHCSSQWWNRGLAEAVHMACVAFDEQMEKVK